MVVALGTAHIQYEAAGGNGMYHETKAWTGTFPSTFAALEVSNTADVCMYVVYTTAAPSVGPHETFASGYLTRYMRRQVIGYHYDSGDLRPMEVTASGELKVHQESGQHVVADVEVEMSSGMFIDGVSGVHVYVESGARVVTTVDISGSPVDISGGHVWISGQHVYVESGVHVVGGGSTSGLGVWISGQHVYVESGVHVITDGGGSTSVSGQPVDISGGHVWISGQHIYQESGYIGIVDLGEGSITASVSGEAVHIGGAANIRTQNLIPVTAASGGETLCASGAWCSGDIHSLILKNISGNEDIFVGGENCKPFSGHGFLLAGEEAVTLDVDEVCEVWVCANKSGNAVTYIGTDY